jgi:hypothetical protein
MAAPALRAGAALQRRPAPFGRWPPPEKNVYNGKWYKLEAELLREHPFVRAGMKEAQEHKIRNDTGKSGRTIFSRISEGHFLQANGSLARLGGEGRLLRTHIYSTRGIWSTSKTVRIATS